MESVSIMCAIFFKHFCSPVSSLHFYFSVKTLTPIQSKHIFIDIYSIFSSWSHFLNCQQATWVTKESMRFLVSGAKTFVSPLAQRRPTPGLWWPRGRAMGSRGRARARTQRGRPAVGSRHPGREIFSRFLPKIFFSLTLKDPVFTTRVQPIRYQRGDYQHKQWDSCWGRECS